MASFSFKTALTCLTATARSGPGLSSKCTFCCLYQNLKLSDILVIFENTQTLILFKETIKCTLKDNKRIDDLNNEGL